MALMGCAYCSSPKSNGDVPYIRTQPGIEYCGDMCQKFADLKCTGYYEDLDIDCSKDIIYSDLQKCQIILDAGTNDAGKAIIKLTCTEFCEYELKNSVPLNPKCLVDNLLVCSKIETICR